MNDPDPTTELPHPVPVPVVPPQVQPDPLLFTVGDIGVSRHWIVTPNGTAPLPGSAWIVRDLTYTQESIPAYAVVLAVVFALFCLLGLFFLLIKERRTVGYVEVQVHSGSLVHLTQIPVADAIQVAQIRATVGQAQSMAAGWQPG